MAGVVYHLNNAATEYHRAALRNVRNLLDDIPGLAIELVLHGDAVIAAVGSLSHVTDELVDLQRHRVVIAVCQNTLRQKQIPESALIAGITLVPSGQGELVRKQLEGYAYVKP